MKKRIYYIGAMIISFTLTGIIIYYIRSAEEGWKTSLEASAKENLEKIEALLKEYENVMANNPKSVYIKEKVQALNPNILTDVQKKRRFVLLGDIYLNHYRKEVDDLSLKEDYFLYASRYYERASEKAEETKDRDVMKRIRAKMAQIYIEDASITKDKKKAKLLWEKAYQILKENQSLALLFAEELWDSYLDQATCLEKIGKYREAIQLLSKVISKSDADSIWSKALRMKSDLLVKLSLNPEYLKKYNEKSEKKIDAKSLLENAFKNYKEIIAQISVLDENVFYAQKGLIQIYMLKKDRKNIYNTINSMDLGPTFPEVKSDALILLSDYEKQEGNYKTAIDHLNTSLRQYKNPEIAGKVTRKLYEIYKEGKNWDMTIETMYSICVFYPSEATVKEIMQKFMPYNENEKEHVNLFDKIKISKYAEKYYKKILKMLNQLKHLNPKIWHTVKNEDSFIRAQMLFLQNDFNNATTALFKCLDNKKQSKKIDEAIYYYLVKCEYEGRKNLGSIIFKAKQYVSQYPKAKHTKKVLMILLDSYIEAGFYKLGGEVANKMFFEELKKVKKGGGEEDVLRWLNISGKLAKCYIELGNFQKAKIIFNSIKSDALKRDGFSKLFKNWSDITAEEQQYREAVRLLDLYQEKIKDKIIQTKFKVARNLLMLKRGGNKEFLELVRLFDKIKNDSTLPEKEVKKWKREIGEVLLDYAFSHKIQYAGTLVEDMVNEFSNEEWTNYWVLRSITPLFGTEQLELIAKKHKEILDAKFTGNQNVETAKFLKTQLELINNLVSLEKKAETFKKEKGF